MKRLRVIFATAAADLAFGLDVLGAWCQADPAGNIVLSPSSLASGLGMAYLGAGGQTARAIAAVLHLPESTKIEAGLQARSWALSRLDGPDVTVAAADRVWTDPKLPRRRLTPPSLPRPRATSRSC